MFEDRMKGEREYLLPVAFVHLLLALRRKGLAAAGRQRTAEQLHVHLGRVPTEMGAPIAIVQYMR